MLSANHMKTYIRLILLFLLYVCTPGRSYSQQAYPDSLIRLAAATADTSERCRIYLELSRYYDKNDTLVARRYMRNALGLEKAQKDEKKLIQTQLVFAKHFINLRQADEAKRYADKASGLIEKNGGGKELAMLHYYNGCIYLLKGDSKRALDDFIRSYKLADASHDETLKAHVNASFGVIYQQQNQLDSALVYYKKTLAYFEANDPKSEYTMVGLQNIGNIFLSKGAYAEGLTFLKRALEQAEARNDRLAQMTILGNMANGYLREGKLEAAETYASKLAQEAEKNGIPLQVLYGKTLIASIRTSQKKHDDAIRDSKEALVLAEQLKMASFVTTMYELLITNYEQKNDYKQAYAYKTILMHYKDSLSEEENKQYIEEIKHKYNLQQKNQELLLKTELIRQIQTSNRQKTMIIASLVIIVLTGIISVFLYMQRRKIKDELRRKDLDLENRNKHFEAFINGQEQERKRIASDLHDGLGQNLVMLKMGVSNLKAGDPEQQDKVNNYTREIEQMIEETRKLSHNMMPGVLVDLGLLKALKSLVSEINLLHPSLHTELIIAEPFRKMPAHTEIQVYRIIQELLNNVIKHAAASQCRISLSSAGQNISISIKDNGRGFDNQAPKTGIGLQNVQSRVNSLNGKLSIESGLNQGSAFTITLANTEQDAG